MSKAEAIDQFGGLTPLHIKNGKTMMNECPYCHDPHVTEYLCLKARAAGVNKDDLPGAYNVDMKTGEVK